MSIIRKLIRYAVETTYGTYAASDTAVPHHDGTLNVNTLAGDVVERNVELLSLDTLASLRAGEHASIQFEVGIAQTLTPGTPPPWAPLLLGSACAETALTGYSGAATLATGTNAVVLADISASDVDNYYVGQSVTLAGIGTGWDGTHVITAYDGTTHAIATSPALPTRSGGGTATGTAAIADATRYTPVSAGLGSISFDYYEVDEDTAACTKWTFCGCRGEVTLTLNEKAEPVLKVDMVGRLHAGPTATSAPAMDYSAWGVPLVPNSTVSRITTFQGYTACIARNFSFMTGAKATYTAKINDERARIPTRSPTATLDMDMILSSEFDLDAAIAGRTVGPFALSHGATGATPIVFGSNSMQVTGKNPGSSRTDGVYNVTVNLAFRTAGAGDDSWYLTC